MAGRISTLCLMIISGLFALLLQSAFQAFKILLQIGAGTGLLFLLRWFWWRINAFSEITAMVVSFLAAVYFEFIHTRLGLSPFEDWEKFVIGVAITTIAWITVTIFTKPTGKETLIKFYRSIKPGGPGWDKFIKSLPKDGKTIEEITNADKKHKWDVPSGLISVFLGCVSVYSALFSIGFWIYSNYTAAAITTMTAVMASIGLIKNWQRLKL